MRSLLLLLALSGCKKDDPAPKGEPSVIFDVEATGRTILPGLETPVEVLFNAYGVPTIFGRSEPDVARVHGYLIARDRFFFVDLSRRLGLGTVSSLVGQDGWDVDIEARQRGVTTVADLMLAELDRAPGAAAYVDGYAAGINAFIDEVKAGTLPPPAEMELLAPLLGMEAVDALQPFDRRDVVAGMAYLMFETAWEPGDVGRANDIARLDTLFDGVALEAERKAGLRPDVFDRVIPPVDAASAPDFSPTGSTPFAQGGGGPAPRVPLDLLDRLQERLERSARRMGKDREKGFGSNTWAVAGAHTASGGAILAADPHLPLSIPSIMWLVGIDTRELGGGDLHLVGAQATPMPFLGQGTNGDVAWGQTNTAGGDITDWYAEVIELDANGAPASSLFQGAQQPLVAIDDVYEIADVPALGSVGRTETLTRYTTFDGRWIHGIEGRPVDGPADAGAGEAAVNLMGRWIVPEDTDGDGQITAVSFDYTGFDMRAMVRAIDGIPRAGNLQDFIEVSKDFVAYGLQIVAADSSGSILYTPYMAMPCRSYLPRNPDGSFAEGADPRALIDGTQYGGFEVPADSKGHVDFSQTSDPARCLVAWGDQPWSLDPARGYLASANADPGGYSLDDDLTNDGPYIGGPWAEGFRLDEIHRQLEALVTRGAVTAEDLRVVQSNHTSVIGRMLAPTLLDAIDAGAAASASGATTGADSRLAALYDADPARFDEVHTRLSAWRDRGWQAESGVETFYDGAPTSEQVDDAVATMIFNAWMGRFQSLALDDEAMPKGDTGTFGILRMMLESRGDPSFASYNAATGESAYWDRLGTPEVETSEEIALLALVDALAFLESAPTGPGEGGFGTADMNQWIWGYRHLIDMEPLLLELFGQDLAFLVADFAITPATFPVAEGLSGSDPRADLPGFPRHGDHKNVDAGNTGTSGTRFDNSYGAVARMVIELGPDGATGLNMMPGGQSSDPTSPHFSDQARSWLGNEAMPISTIPSETAAQAVGRETFTPW